METKKNNGNSNSNGAKQMTKSKVAPKEKSNDSEVATGLHNLFEDMLKDIYWAEKALTKAIPKMIKNATSEELVEALETHLAETEEQVTRCEQVFEAIGAKAVAKKCDAMEGLIKEAQSIMEETQEGVVRDAGIIAAAQKVEHYEIASYGTLCAFAKTLGEEEALALLEQTLEEEKNADQTLTTVAETAVNVEAAGEEEDEDDESEEESDVKTTASKTKKSAKS